MKINPFAWLRKVDLPKDYRLVVGLQIDPTASRLSSIQGDLLHPVHLSIYMRSYYQSKEEINPLKENIPGDYIIKHPPERFSKELIVKGIRYFLEDTNNRHTLDSISAVEVRPLETFYSYYDSFSGSFCWRIGNDKPLTDKIVLEYLVNELSKWAIGRSLAFMYFPKQLTAYRDRNAPEAPEDRWHKLSLMSGGKSEYYDYTSHIPGCLGGTMGGGSF